MQFIVNKAKLCGKFILDAKLLNRWKFSYFQGERVINISNYKNIIWYVCLILAAVWLIHYIFNFLSSAISIQDVLHAFVLTLITFVRLMILLLFCSVVFIPLGIYIGFRPRLAAIVQPILQFLSSFPANLLFPVAVIYITKYNLTPDIWLSPLIIIGAQWYILFNVIAGTAQIPSELLDIMKTFKITGWLKYKKIILPAIMPYYLTGAITCAGAGWNCSIVSEAVSWGNKSIYAHGIGAYITQMTAENNLHGIALGVIVMSFFVVMLNRLFWRRIYNYVTKKFSYI